MTWSRVATQVGAQYLSLRVAGTVGASTGWLGGCRVVCLSAPRRVSPRLGGQSRHAPRRLLLRLNTGGVEVADHGCQDQMRRVAGKMITSSLLFLM